MYFCICCSLILLLDYCSTRPELYQPALNLYGLAIGGQALFLLGRDMLIGTWLCRARSHPVCVPQADF